MAARLDRSMREKRIDDVGVHLGPLIVALRKRRGERLLQAFGAAADDDDAILEERGIDAGLLPFQDLLLRIEDVVEAYDVNVSWPLRFTAGPRQGIMMLQLPL
jgi:hypothetical protein